MSNPVRASDKPYPTQVEKGDVVFWCACGQSKNQPYCDGSHKGSDFTPLRHEVERSGTVFFCGCKATGTAPLCDGSHNK